MGIEIENFFWGDMNENYVEIYMYGYVWSCMVNDIENLGDDVNWG